MNDCIKNGHKIEYKCLDNENYNYFHECICLTCDNNWHEMHTKNKDDKCYGQAAPVSCKYCSFSIA